VRKDTFLPKIRALSFGDFNFVPTFCRRYFSAMIRTIGLAIAFSPTAERMLAEADHLARQFKSTLVLIHVGEQGREQEAQIESLLASRGLTKESVKIRWERGHAAKAILRACDAEKVDLLVAGALRKENLLQYYLGTIARHIMRRAKCSVLLLTQPSLSPAGFRNVVVNAEDSPFTLTSLKMSVDFCRKESGAWLHVVRELKMYGLAMSSSDQCSEDEYEHTRQQLVRDEIEKVEKLLLKIPHENLKVNIKVVAGKSGFELAQFARRKEADLLVVSAPPRRFQLLDRVFTHDLEYVFADLPSNLLIVHQGKEKSHD
jgi:nucleotide-binding universal stress UspA family protein